MINLFKFILHSIVLIELVLLFGGCKSGNPEIKCDFNQNDFVREIQDELSADSIMMSSVSLKEEVYFPALTAIRLIIDNATTPIYDFKNYNLGIPDRFDDYETMNNKFKEFGKKYALRIFNDCDIREFNDILIDFGKTDKRGNFNSIFICHYSDILNPQRDE